MADLAHREVYTISRPKGRRGLRTSKGGRVSDGDAR